MTDIERKHLQCELIQQANPRDTEQTNGWHKVLDDGLPQKDGKYFIVLINFCQLHFTSTLAIDFLPTYAFIFIKLINVSSIIQIFYRR